MKIFGCIDKCVENNCCRGVDPVGNELSSYIETTETKPSNTITPDERDTEVA